MGSKLQKDRQQRFLDQGEFPGGPHPEVVTNPSKRFPYSAVGRVIVKYENLPQDQEASGTGFIINSRAVVTAAHLLHPSKASTLPDNPIAIFFLPQVGFASVYIPVTRYMIPDAYFSKESLHHDMAILFLQENTIITENMILPLKWNFDLNQNTNKMIHVVGYPRIVNPESIQEEHRLQHCARGPPTGQEHNFLFYIHTTYEGNSGGPVIVEEKSPFCNQSLFYAIGIHKGVKPNNSSNFCVLFEDQCNRPFSKYLKLMSLAEDTLYVDFPKFDALCQKSVETLNSAQNYARLNDFDESGKHHFFRMSQCKWSRRIDSCKTSPIQFKSSSFDFLGYESTMKEAKEYEERGRTEFKSKKYVEAISSYTLSLQLKQQNYSSLTFSYADTLCSIAEAYSMLPSMEHIKQGISNYRKALNIRTSLLEKNSLKCASIMHNIGSGHLRSGQLQKALQLYLQEKRIKESIVGKDHLLLGVTLRQIGTYYKRKADPTLYSQAQKNYHSATIIFLKSNQDTSVDCGLTYFHLSDLKKQEGEIAQAKIFLKRSINIFIEAGDLARDYLDVAQNFNDSLTSPNN